MPVPEKKPIRTIQQKYAAWRSQELGLYDDEIRLVYRSGANRSSRTVPLEWIDRNESEARLYPGWARAGVFWCGLALVAAVAAGLEWGAPWFAVGVAFAVGAVLFAVARGAFARDAIYFYNAFSGEFLFALLVDQPDRETVAGFLAAIQEQLARRQEQAKMESELPSVAAEISHLARLREKSVITQDEFSAKKTELIEDLLRE